MPRKPLPQQLRAAAFTVAQGRSLGLGQSRLRGPDLQRPFRGVRIGTGTPAGAPSAEQVLRTRCAALSLVVPDDAVFSHVTAARLWPLPLPWPHAAEPIHLSVQRPARPPRRSGVAGHVILDPQMTVVRRGGLRLVDASTLWCQLAAQLSVPDLVAVGDALTLQPVFAQTWEERPWITLDQLTCRVQLFRGRGKANAATALALVRPGAESRQETLLRLALLTAGLPEPEVNVDVCDSRGLFLGRGDLVYRRWKVIVEYDGDQHRTDTRQFDRDVLRLEGFAVAGWTVVRVVGRSFLHERDACVARVCRALGDAGWTG